MDFSGVNTILPIRQHGSGSESWAEESDTTVSNRVQLQATDGISNRLLE